MAYTTVGINVKVEGGKEFQSEMKAAAAQARQLDAELKNLTSSLDGSESSIGNAKEAINGYQTKISNCQTVIDRYNEELKRQQTSQDGTKESIANCQRTIANWTNEQNKAKSALEALNKYLKEHSTEITSNKQKLEQLDSKLKENTTALKNNQVQLSNNKNNVKLLTEQRKLLEERSNLLNQKEEALKEKLKLTSDAFGENSKEVKNVEQEYRDLSTEVVTNTEKLKSNYRQIVENTNSFATMSKTMKTVGETFTSIGNKLASIGTKLTATVTTPLVAAGTAAISAASDVQQYHNQFSALLKSSGKADELWDKLQNYGIKSPFDVTGLADAAKQLMGFGFSADETYDTLQTLGNVAMGDADHLYNIARAYGQVVSQGKLSKRYLNAMVNNDFSPYLALADYLGTSAEEVQSILADTKQTEITVETLQEAIKASAEEGGRYYGMLEAMNNTLKGQLANLKEAIWAIGAKFGSYFLEPLRDIVSVLATVVEKVQDWDEEQVKSIVNMAMFAAAAGPVLTIFGKLNQGIGTLSLGFSNFYKVVGNARGKLLEAFNVDGVGTKITGTLKNVFGSGTKDVGKAAGTTLANSLTNEVASKTKNKIFEKIDTKLNLTGFKESLKELKDGAVETTNSLADTIAKGGDKAVTATETALQKIRDKIKPDKSTVGYYLTDLASPTKDQPEIDWGENVDTWKANQNKELQSASLIPTSTMTMDIDEKPVTSKLEKLKEKLKSSKTYLTEYKNGWTEDFKKIGENTSNLIKGIGQKFSPLTMRLTSFKNSIVSIFSPLLSGIKTTITTVGNTAFNLVKGVLSKITTLFMSFLAPAAIIMAIMAVVGVIGTKFTDEIQNLCAKLQMEGPNIIKSFCDGIKNNIMSIMQSGSEIISNFLYAISYCIPNVLEGAGQIMEGFARGMSNHLPSIISAAIKLITTLVTGLADNLHYVVAFATELVLGLLNGIIQNLPQLIQAAVDIILALFNALVTNLPTLIEAAVQMVEALIQGLTDNLDLIIDAVVQIAVTIVTALIEHGPEILAAGADLIWALIKGLGSLAVELWNAVVGIGGQIIGGIWSGITGKATEFVENVKNWFNDNVLSPIKEVLGIHSPSTELETMGENTAAGYEKGLDNSQPGLETKISNWAGNLLTHIRNVLNGNTETETVEIEIDFTQAEQQAEEGLENIKTIVATKYAEINELFKTANLTIVTDTKTQYTELSSVAVTTVTNMVTGMVATLTTLKSSFDGLFDDLTTDTVKQVALLTAGVIAEYELLNTQSARTLNITLQTAVKQFTLMKEECLVVVKLMITQIVTTIGRLPAEFNTIGQKMMTELKKGITNNKQQVIDETSALVKKLVAVFVEGLGIHSPARKMVWIGEMMIAGLMKGLSNSQLMKFTSNTVQKLEDAFANGKLSMGSTIEILKSGGVDALIAYLNDKTTNSSGSDSKKSGATAIYPLEGGPYEITSWFGARPASDTNGIGSTNHGGIDIGAGLGTAIKSMAAGTVTLAGDNGGYGNCVIIDHGNGLASLYGHMSEIGATLGQTVAAGQSIGKVGSTGNSTGPHLHFEVRQNGEKIDPYPYLQGAAVVGGNALANALQTAKQLMESGMTKEQINAMGSSLSTAAGKFTAVSGDLATWIKTAMAITGEPATSFNYLYTAAMAESGGDPTAINLWDSNAAAGNPSKGLMQTIQTTFDAYKMTGFDNVWDPISNLIASIRYMRSRYGSVAACCLPRMNGWYGYKVGTRKVPYDMLAQIHAGEAILPADQNPYSESGGDYLTAIVAKVLNKATDVANKNVEVMVATNANNSGILNTHVNTGLASEAEDRKLNRIINVALEGVSRPSNNETNYTITQNFDTHNPSPSEIARSTKNMIRKLNR